MGDGGFLMLHTEIVTALQEGLKINILLLDNSGFQCIHNLQRSQGIPSFANEFRYREGATERLTGNCLAIDYAGIAAAYGGRGFSVKTIEELTEAFEGVRASSTVNLVDIKVLPGTMTEGMTPGGAWGPQRSPLTRRSKKLRRRSENSHRR